MEQKIQLPSKWQSKAEHVVSRLGAVKDPEAR